jgi:hypothetical protein
MPVGKHYKAQVYNGCIVDPDGNEWYGFTQDEVDAEYAKTVKNREAQQRKSDEQEALVFAAFLANVYDREQAALESTDYYNFLAENVIYFDQHYNGDGYAARLFLNVVLRGISPEDYIGENTPPTWRWYYEVEDDYC